MRGWFDFAIADELHQLAGDTAQGNGLGVLGRAAQRLIALTGTLMGGYADDLFNIFYRMEPHAMVREGFAYGGQGRRDFQEQYGVLETIEKVEEADNACSRATKKTVRVLRKPGASPMLFGKFLMTTTAFLSLEDISDNLPRYDESVISVDMDEALQQAYEKLEEDIRSAMKAHRGNKSLMSILLNTLLLYPDHPYDFDEIWARAFDPQTKEYVKFLVTEPANLTREALYAKERALIADVKEELRQGRRCQVYATYTGEKDVTLRLEAVLRQEGIRVAILRSPFASTSFPASSTKAKTTRSPHRSAWLARLKILTPSCPPRWSSSLAPTSNSRTRLKPPRSRWQRQARPQRRRPVRRWRRRLRRSRPSLPRRWQGSQQRLRPSLPSPGNRSQYATRASLTLDRCQHQLPCPSRMRTRSRRFLPRPMMSQRMNPTTWTSPLKRPIWPLSPSPLR